MLSRLIISDLLTDKTLNFFRDVVAALEIVDHILVALVIATDHKLSHVILDISC